MNTSWANAGDACPKCGRKNTTLSDFRQKIVDIPVAEGIARTREGKPSFLMTCADCGFQERVPGVPGKRWD